LIIFARILQQQNFNHRKFKKKIIFIDHFLEINRDKRFARPFPDMNRFLSTSHKLHHHHHEEPTTKSGTEVGIKKHDFHAYLCR